MKVVDILQPIDKTYYVKKTKIRRKMNNKQPLKLNYCFRQQLVSLFLSFLIALLISSCLEFLFVVIVDIFAITFGLIEGTSLYFEMKLSTS